jgi:hypothetical protein
MTIDTLVRPTDPDTSRRAAESVAEKVGSIQVKVMRFAFAMDPEPFTDVELCTFFNNAGSTFRTRRSELVQRGFLRLVDDSGRFARWGLTEEGRAWATTNLT